MLKLGEVCKYFVQDCKFGTKNALFGYFWVRIFLKTIVIFEISILKFVYLQNFLKNQKCLNLESKMPDFGIFGREFENNFLICEISTLKFV